MKKAELYSTVGQILVCEPRGFLGSNRQKITFEDDTVPTCRRALLINDLNLGLASEAAAENMAY